MLTEDPENPFISRAEKALYDILINSNTLNTFFLLRKERDFWKSMCFSWKRLAIASVIINQIWLIHWLIVRFIL